MLNSVRARLTLWYVALLGAVLVVFSGGVYTLLAQSLYDRLDSGLSAVLPVATVSLTHDAEEGQSVQGAASSTAIELYNPEQTLAIFDGAGRLLAESNPDDDFPTRLPPLGLVRDDEPYVYTAYEDEDEGEEPEAEDAHRVVVQRVTIASAGREYILLASQPEEIVVEELEALRKILFFAIPITLVLTGAGGWFLARKSLEPAVAMSEQARRIGAEDLDRRLPVANPRDELGRLATNFNELLGRLSSAFALQRQFMADASHELRTPLSVIRTTADVTLSKEERTEREYREALDLMNEQARRLARIVQDMFTLARADAGQYPLHMGALYFDELVVETARAASVLAAARDVSVEVASPPELACHGDEGLLRQMVMNLLDNAVKHTPAGGVVRVGVEAGPSAYRLTVADTGSGIPAEARPHVFERFYRADKARSRNGNSSGGAGLGLAIARWIAEAHGGRLVLARSGESGSTFLAEIPRQTGAPA